MGPENNNLNQNAAPAEPVAPAEPAAPAEPPMPEPLEPIPTPEPISVPEPTPEPTSEPTPVKKESNKNNYILAGVCIGIIAVIIILICGGIFGGWFGDDFLGGSLFGGSTSSGSGNGESGFDAGIMGFVAGKAQEYDYSDPEADAINEESLQVLKSALIKYQTNNMGNLPPIDESGQEYVYENSTHETPLVAFYNNYLGDDFVDEWGYKPSVTFYASPDVDFDDYDYNNYSLLNYSTLINVYYNATCNEDGELESSTNSRSFAITIGKSDYSSYYCVSNS